MREAEDGVRDGRGDEERRPMNNQFQQITGKKEKQKYIFKSSGKCQ